MTRTVYEVVPCARPRRPAWPLMLVVGTMLALFASVLLLAQPADARLQEPGIGSSGAAPGEPQQANGDYDADDDGLIEIGNLAQLDAIRYDLNGDGTADDGDAAYAAAFPGAAPGMGCPSDGCTGYELVANLDFDTNGNGQADAGDAYWNDGAGWGPIGRNHQNRYTATFEGNGHTISNLYINRSGSHFIGFFGATGSNAVIKRVGMISVDVTGNAGVGGLVGDNVGGTVTASYATGSVSSVGWNAGGLVGYSGNAIGDGAEGSIKIIEPGISTITASYASANVAGSSNVGGLVGYNHEGIVTYSYSIGSIAGNENVGGLVGVNYGTINASYWDIRTSGYSSSAGGEGKTTSELQSPTSNSGIYATWDPAVWDFGASSEYPKLKVFGAVGATERSSQDYDAADDGLIEISNLAQLDAIRYDLNGDGVADGGDAAYAAAFTGAAAGMGCPASGCKGYELAADLDLGTPVDAVSWLPIGTQDDPFAATFDGNNHTISNLYVNRGASIQNVGLFGVAGAGSVIRRVGMVTVDVFNSHPGDQRYGPTTGGLVGWNRGGAIEGSYATGKVVERLHGVGGLVGWNSAGGTISDSYSTASVSGYWAVGGLVGGGKNSSIRRSYATGDVTGSRSNIGGLIGDNRGNGTITTSYSIGAVSGAGDAVGGLVGRNENGTVTDSYWNTQTSGQTTSVGGEGKTTRELQSPTGNTGIYATWDPAVWDFGTDREYPVLKNTGPSVAAQRAVVGDPTNLRVVSVGDGQVTLGWDPAANAEFHWIWSVKADGTGGKGTGAEGTATSATIIDLAIGQYHFIVLAGRMVGGQPQLSNWSNWVQATVTTASAATSDRAALIALYRATDGDNWSNSRRNDRKWLVDDPHSPIGEWYGVTTDVDGRVTELVLEHNQLNGTLPAELGNLTGLTRLSLGSNWLSGKIPPELGNLSQLTRLGLTSNRLTGPIPHELGLLTRLTHLSMGNNELSGQLPPSLGNLAALTKLYLSNNQLDGPMPATLGGLTNLTTLYITNNRLSGPIPAELGSLTGLTHLHLSRNRLSGKIPEELGDLTNLRELYLNDQNYFRGLTFSNIGSVANLERQLNNDGNYLHGAIPAELSNLGNLRELDLSRNRLDYGIPSSLGRLSNLEVLNLSTNRLSASIPFQLGDLSKLEVLDLSDNDLQVPIPHYLSNLSNLQELYLQRNGLVAQIPPGLGSLSDLAVMDLSENDLQLGIPSELGNLSGVRYLYLNDNELNGTIPGELTALSNLRELDLRNNALSGETPPALCELDSLVQINLEGNPLLLPSCAATAVALNSLAIAQDRAALIALYNALGGSDWPEQEGWLTQNPIDQWHGVVVATEHDPNHPNRTGRVISLDLSDNLPQESLLDWANTFADNAGTADEALYWLETLKLRIIADGSLEEGDLDFLMFVSPMMRQLEASIYEEQRVGPPTFTRNIATTALRLGVDATPVVKAPVTTATWGVRILTNAGGLTGRIVARADAILKTPAGNLAKKGNLAVTIVTAGMDTKLLSCLGTEAWLATGLVQPGVGYQRDFGQCIVEIDNVIGDMISSVLFGINPAEVAGRAIGYITSAGSTIQDFITPLYTKSWCAVPHCPSPP